MKFYEKYFKPRTCFVLLLAIVFISSLPPVSVEGATIPNMITLERGAKVKSNSDAAVDYSNLEEGIVDIKYKGGANKRIKVQVTKSKGTTYTYNLNNKGNYETFPLTEGNGTYSIKVFENVTGTKYAQVFSYSLKMTLRHELLPYLYSNQYVNYKASKNVAAKGVEITSGLTTDLAKLQSIYGYVINNYSYDHNLAATAPSTYLPVIDNVMAAKKGICFDYAALMAGLLRTQNIPCKLVVGYQGTLYHAWINVYLPEIGWVEKAIYFDGTSWSMMDPTYAASASGHVSSTTYSKSYAY